MQNNDETPGGSPQLPPEKCLKLLREYQERYQKLADDLALARVFLAPGESGKPNRKLAFLCGVGAVVEFLQGDRFFTDNELELPLIQLMFELHTVDLGIPSEDFAVKPGGRGTGTRYRAFQMSCALLLNTYISAGVSMDEACSRIVRIMNKKMAPGTVKDWRVDFSNIKNQTDAAKSFRSLRDEWSDKKFADAQIDLIAHRVKAQFADLELKGHQNRVTKTRIKSKR
jgi:hypothetical protein